MGYIGFYTLKEEILQGKDLNHLTTISDYMIDHFLARSDYLGLIISKHIWLNYEMDDYIIA